MYYKIYYLYNITIDIRNLKNHVFNIKLAKLTGLYQLLDPGTVKYCGRKMYRIAMVCVFLCTCLNSLILIPSGLYYWTKNIFLSIDYFWKSEVTLYTIYKMWLVVRHSNDIWNYLSIVRYDSTYRSTTRTRTHIGSLVTTFDVVEG